MKESPPSAAKKGNRWLLIGAAAVALFGPVVYAFGPEGTGVPHEYIPVGMVLPALFSPMGLLVLAWYGSQYLVYAAVVFVVLKLAERLVVRRRYGTVAVSKGGR